MQCSPKYLRGWIQNPCAVETLYPNRTKWNRVLQPGPKAHEKNQSPKQWKRQTQTQALEKASSMGNLRQLAPQYDGAEPASGFQSIYSRKEQLQPCQLHLPHPMAPGTVEQQLLPQPNSPLSTTRFTPSPLHTLPPLPTGYSLPWEEQR